jgi:hypothetical protein
VNTRFLSVDHDKDGWKAETDKEREVIENKGIKDEKGGNERGMR